MADIDEAAGERKRIPSGWRWLLDENYYRKDEELLLVLFIAMWHYAPSVPVLLIGGLTLGLVRAKLRWVYPLLAYFLLAMSPPLGMFGMSLSPNLIVILGTGYIGVGIGTAIRYIWEKRGRNSNRNLSS